MKTIYSISNSNNAQAPRTKGEPKAQRLICLFSRPLKQALFSVLAACFLLPAPPLLLIEKAHAAFQFKVEPSFTFQQQYDDNLNLSATNEQEDYISTLSPGARISILSKTGSLSLNYQLNATFYWLNSDRNFIGHEATLDGRQALTRHLTIRFRDRFARKDEPREIREPMGPPEEFAPTEYLIGTRIVRSTFIRNTAALFVDYEYGRGRLLTAGYSNNMLINDSPQIEDSRQHVFSIEANHALDAWNIIALRFGHQISEFQRSSDFQGEDITFTYTRKLTRHTSAFVRYGFVLRSFDDETRDYLIHSGDLGINHAFSPTFSGSAQVGYYSRDREVGGTQGGMKGSLSLTKRWLHLQATVRGSAGYDESYIDPENLGFTQFYNVSSRARYQYSPRISLSAEGSFRHDDFPGAREQDTFRATADISFIILRWLSGSVGYQYQRRDATDNRLDYDNNKFFLRLTAVFDRLFK